MGTVSLLLEPATLAPPLDVRAVFGAEMPLELDVGCGKGKFLAARAKAFPGTAFLGIDRQPARIEKVSRKLTRLGLLNVRLLNMEAACVVEELIAPLSVSAFYVFFPDPWPKRRHHRRRLFSPPFMNSLHRTLLPGGEIRIATDHADYFAWIQRLLKKDARFREVPPFEPTEEERSEFEITFRDLGQPIYRCAFTKAPGAEPAPAAPPPRPG